MSAACLWILPRDRTGFKVKSHKDFLRLFSGNALGSCGIESLTLGELLRFQKECLAFLQRQKVHELRGLVVRRREPVRGAGKARTEAGSLSRRLGAATNWPALGINSFGPGELLHELSRSQKLPVGSIEHVDEAIPVRLNQQLPRRAVGLHVYENRGLISIEVEDIVRCELEMPLQFACVGIQRENTRGVEVVTGTNRAVEVRRGVAGGPEERVRFRIVRARHPCCPPAVKVQIAWPAF